MQICPLGFDFFEVILTVNATYLSMFGALTILDLTMKRCFNEYLQKRQGGIEYFADSCL